MTSKPGRDARRRAALAVAVLVAATCAPAHARAAPAEPAGYRMDDYRAPTPASLAGARVLDTAAAHALWARGGAVFVDVMPRPEKPAGLKPGTIWRDTPRRNLPGSAWLANVGYGALAPEIAEGFARDLATLAADDKAKPLVFYCQRSCWMSWNAAKRALALGHRDVAWYPDGTDGWSEAGWPLDAATPYRSAP